MVRSVPRAGKFRVVWHAAAPNALRSAAVEAKDRSRAAPLPAAVVAMRAQVSPDESLHAVLQVEGRAVAAVAQQGASIKERSSPNSLVLWLDQAPALLTVDAPLPLASRLSAQLVCEGCRVVVAVVRRRGQQL